jgi:hypothetical protein
MGNSQSRPEEQAALELLWELPSDATFEERLIGWIIADVMARWGMPLPWTNADPSHGGPPPVTNPNTAI